MWLVRTTSGRFTQLFLNLVSLRDLFGVGTKLKESIFKKNNQINSTYQPKYWSCQKNGFGGGQVQDWHPNEKMVVVLVCLFE